MQHHKVVVFTKNNAKILDGIETSLLDQYSGWSNVLIDPDLSAVSGVPPHLWKIYHGITVPLNESEKIARLKDIEQNGLDNEIRAVKPRVSAKIVPQQLPHYLAYFVIIVLLSLITGRVFRWF